MHKHVDSSSIARVLTRAHRLRNPVTLVLENSKISLGTRARANYVQELARSSAALRTNAYRGSKITLPEIQPPVFVCVTCHPIRADPYRVFCHEQTETYVLLHPFAVAEGSEARARARSSGKTNGIVMSSSTSTEREASVPAAAATCLAARKGKRLRRGSLSRRSGERSSGDAITDEQVQTAKVFHASFALATPDVSARQHTPTPKRKQ